MTDEQTLFWRAIEAAPGADLPVLVFADFLDDIADPLAAVLRECVAEGRRPGVFPDGQAFWVTTTADPIATGTVRQGRRHVAVRVRPQPSWLAGFYWSFLAAEQRLCPFIRHATVWRYVSIEDAYRDLLRAQQDMRKQLYDPKTGQHRFTGLTDSSWRNEARRAIAVALRGLPPDADAKARAKAVTVCYPFGERRGHPYKMFLKERRLALGPKPAGGGLARVEDSQCDWCRGEGCIACAAKRFAEEAERCSA